MSFSPSLGAVSSEKIPNFFIVGAAKSGTTSLWMYLKQHPEIFMPNDIANKEPAYFCHEYGMEDYRKYLALFSLSRGAKAVGEASHAYLTSPESAEWIHRENPNAKIILILRNPIDRAYSLYKWMVSHGYEGIPSFEEALSVEKERSKSDIFKINCPEYFHNFMYYGSGLYSIQLQRYFDVFPTEQIKVILFEDLIEKPVAVTKDIYKFLHVDSKFEPNVGVYNKSERQPFLISWHERISRLERRFHLKRRGRLIRGMLYLNQSILGSKWPALRESTGAELRRKYRSDIDILAIMINRNLEMWIRGKK